MPVVELRAAIAQVKILNPYLAPKVAYQKHSFPDVRCVDQRGINYTLQIRVK